MASDEQFYAMVADEMARNHIDNVLWTKAFAQSGGEETATKSRYCRLRAEQLQSAAEQHSKSVQRTYAKTHGKQLGFGLLAFVIGILVTCISYSTTKPGGHYIITCGLIVGGIVAISKGSWGLLRSPFVNFATASTLSPVSSSLSNSSYSATNPTPQHSSTEEAIQPASGLPPATLPTPPNTKAEGSDSISNGAGYLIFAVATIIIVIFLVNADSNPTSIVTPQVARQLVPSPITTPAEDRQAALAKIFSELEFEYRTLSNRRADLDLNNPKQLDDYNLRAGDYTRRVQIARSEKARLNE